MRTGNMQYLYKRFAVLWCIYSVSSLVSEELLTMCNKPLKHTNFNYRN